MSQHNESVQPIAADEVDRISPTRRPTGRARGYQKWRSLLFLHWQVSPEELRKRVPDALELDLFDGRAYVGVVPFAMFEVRPRWLPRPFAFDFLETNVRTYVSYRGRPGVYFFSLEAASRPAVWAARTFWKLPYFYAQMKMEQTGNGSPGEEVYYRTQRSESSAGHEVRYQIGESLGDSQPGSLEFFLLERYLLFAEDRGHILEGQVYHTPYPAQQATVLEVSDTLGEAAGIPCPGMPELAHYSPGVDVEVFDLRRLT